MFLLKFIACMFIFFCGVGTGVCIMCLVQINRENKEIYIPFEEKYGKLIAEEKEKEKEKEKLKEIFTYDCLNDPEINKHIPTID